MDLDELDLSWWSEQGSSPPPKNLECEAINFRHRRSIPGAGGARDESARPRYIRSMARQDAFLEQLGDVPLFSALSKKDLRTVATRADLMSAPAGKVLVTEGAAGSEFFAILDGRARVERHGRQVALLGPGNFFGDLAILDRAPRNASVVAETDMEIARLDQRSFDALLDVPGFSKKLLAGLARRLREQDLRQA
jgi:CRP-like cAMP-binding protein